MEMASDKDADRWRRLLESPVDDTTPHRPLWPWVAGAAGVAAAIAIVVGVSLAF